MSGSTLTLKDIFPEIVRWVATWSTGTFHSCELPESLAAAVAINLTSEAFGGPFIVSTAGTKVSRSFFAAVTLAPFAHKGIVASPNKDVPS